MKLAGVLLNLLPVATTATWYCIAHLLVPGKLE